MKAIGKGISDSAGGSIEKDPCLTAGSIRPPGGEPNIRRQKDGQRVACVCVCWESMLSFKAWLDQQRKRENVDLLSHCFGISTAMLMNHIVLKWIIINWTKLKRGDIETKCFGIELLLFFFIISFHELIMNLIFQSHTTNQMFDSPLNLNARFHSGSLKPERLRFLHEMSHFPRHFIL